MNKLKIKLKVPSPEENAAREKKATEKVQAKPKAVRKPPIPKAAKVAKVSKPTAATRAETPIATGQQIKARDGAFYVLNTSIDSGAPAEPTPEPSATDAAMQQTATSVKSPLLGAPPQTTWAPEDVPGQHPTMPLTVAPFDIVEEGPDLGDATSTAFADLARPAASNNAPFSAPIPQPQLTNPVPPTALADENTPHSATTAPSTTFAAVKRTKADLPSFTSSSPIPFSKTANTENAAERPQTANNLSVKELLKSTDTDAKIKKEERSIWDVPETPQQPRWVHSDSFLLFMCSLMNPRLLSVGNGAFCRDRQTDTPYSDFIKSEFIMFRLRSASFM
jgi:hypothetical protein